MPYTLTSDKLSNRQYSVMYNSDIGKQMRESKEPLVNATLMVKWATELFIKFSGHMKARFKGYKVKIGMKENVQRIGQKIEEIMAEKGVDSCDAWQYLTDLLRM